MAAHLHKQIRDAVKTALTGLATTGSRVFANRLQPMTDADLPGLRIYTGEERADGLLLHLPDMYNRDLTLVVEAVGKANATLDDTLDQVSKEVEVALSAGITLGSRNLEVFYTGMANDDDLLEKPVGVKRMTFLIRFQSMSNTPDVLT